MIDFLEARCSMLCYLCGRLYNSLGSTLFHDIYFDSVQTLSMSPMSRTSGGLPPKTEDDNKSS